MSKNARKFAEKNLIQNILLMYLQIYKSLLKNVAFEMNKISLIILSNSTSFYVEDLLVNILMWSQKPQELIIINTSQKKFEVKKELITRFKKLKIKLIFLNKKGYFPGAARNFGIKKATCDFIAFIDMNTLPYNNRWLEINFNYIKKNKLDGIYGQTYYLTSNYKEKIIKSYLW